MKLRRRSFRGAWKIIQRQYAPRWRQLRRVLARMPTHLKPSNQTGKKGEPVFDPVGTNAYLNERLSQAGWIKPGIPRTSPLAVFGTGLDWGEQGLLVEVQFSNYPFCLNNLARAEVLQREQFSLSGHPVEDLILISKARMFPSANSSLHYEQAVGQLQIMMEGHDIFRIPTLVVGLFEKTNKIVKVVWSSYGERSRVPRRRTMRNCRILRSTPHGWHYEIRWVGPR